MKTPVCSEEQGPAREVIAQLLEDALQVEGSEQPEQAFVKPHLVRPSASLHVPVPVPSLRRSGRLVSSAPRGPGDIGPPDSPG
uniref:TBC1 domain family member 2B n=1 Tax=Molossus molossus TaxID=27622 RepID=A0A7J8BM18_MOLMO|nr:TBC1 domain family member 2B [Molossus molossus]